MNPTVWVVNRAGHPYEKVRNVLHNAEIRALSVGNVNPFRLDRLLWHLSRGIVRYTKSEDYLLISGTPILTGLVIPLWLKRHGHVKLFQWNALQGQYILSTISDEQIDNVLNHEVTRV